MLMGGKAVSVPGFSPAAERNKAPILAQLQRLLPATGRALEIASGTGQHLGWFARAMPGWTWQPSDVDAGAFATLAAHTSGGGLSNVLTPVEIDVLSDGWWCDNPPAPALGLFDAIYCANMLHIAPWPTCAALMRGAAMRLSEAGQLITYGPYFEDGVLPSNGNAAFDAGLRASNPSWGVRRREDVEAAANASSLKLTQRVEMPSNNLLLVFAHANTSVS